MHISQKKKKSLKFYSGAADLELGSGWDAVAVSWPTSAAEGLCQRRQEEIQIAFICARDILF